MKMNLPLMKLTIRLLVLMIFFVMIFLISTVLYSTRYWPDVYNYIHANITIKRIPTLSELNLTIIEVEIDVTTEYYATTDDFTDSSTVDGIDFDIDEFTKIDEVTKRKKKRDVLIENFNNDYSEVPGKGVVVDYLFIEDPKETTTIFEETSTIAVETTANLEDTVAIVDKTTAINEEATEVVEELVIKKIVKDLIDESKLVPKNYGDVEMVDRRGVKPEKIILSCHGNRSGISQIYPWIATIFIKNDTTDNQFEYYCDGALITENVLITSARCVSTESPVKPEDVLVFLGKKSLQTMTGNEQIVKVTKIRIHENFTKEGKMENDIALLYFEAPVSSTDDFRPACLFEDTNETTVERSATTAWTVQGEMVPVYFINKNTTCGGDDGGNTTICDSYGLEVPLCPSYGGIYVSKLSTGWYLRGIRKADPSERGICFIKDVQYTPLENFGEWLANNLENKV